LQDTGSAVFQNINTAISNKRYWAALAPYAALAISFFVLHNAWIALLSFHLSMLVFIIFNRSRLPWRTDFKSRHLKIYLINILMGAAALVFYFSWPLSGIPQDVQPILKSIGLSQGNYLYLLAYFVVVNPWIEEYFWRGYLGSASKGITPSDALFAGYHVMLLATVIGPLWLIPAFVILFSAAWFWRQCDRWSQGLGASILSHIAADAAISVVLILMIIK
jgi:uncharacterized protein